VFSGQNAPISAFKVQSDDFSVALKHVASLDMPDEKTFENRMLNGDVW
jgi:hypothetical protein